MAYESISPNMNLVLPAPGLTAGPQYALDLNSSLTLIDQHNHAPGSGVSITPAGLNISSDLPFLSNNATGLRSVRFSAQTAPLALVTDIGALYESGVDLYYNDGLGNQVRLTQSGGVAGSPGSIANLTSPASASYVSGSSTFVWQSAASISANMDFGSAILRNLTSGSFGLTLQPPTLSSNFAITLPTLPGSTKILSMTTGGIISANYDVDNSSLEISSNTLRVKQNGIKQSMLQTCVPGTTATAGNIARSLNISDNGTNTTARVVTNSTITLTTTGRPVRIELVPTPRASAGGAANFLFQSVSPASSINAVTSIQRDGDDIAAYSGPNFSLIGLGAQTWSTNMLCSAVSTVDYPAAGTYTYTLSMGGDGNTKWYIEQCQLIAYEL